MPVRAHVAKAGRMVSAKLGVDGASARTFLALKRSQLRVDSTLAGGTGRVAIVGCGGQGGAIAASVGRLSGWSVTQLVDLDRDRAQRLADRLAGGAVVHESVKALLQEEFDVVAVATTAPSHFGVAAELIEAGVPAVLLEKPVTTSVRSAQDLLRLEAGGSTRIAVDHTRRYMPAAAGIRRILDSGSLGAPRAIYVIGGTAGLAMMGTHYVDLARWLAASDVVRVRATLDDLSDPNSRGSQFHDPVGRVEAVLANGVRLILDQSAGLRLKQSAFTVLCEDGRLEVDERVGSIRLVGAGQRVWQSPYAHKGAVLDGVARALLELSVGEPARCTLADGAAALEAVIACHESARHDGAWVAVPVAGAIRDEEFRFA